MSALTEQLAQLTGLSGGVSRTVLLVAVALALGTAYRAVRFVLRPSQTRAKRLGSAAVWWVMLGATVLGLMLGRFALGAAVGAVCLAGWVEWDRMAGPRGIPAWWRALIGAAIVVSVLLATFGATQAFACFLPVALLIGLPIASIARGRATQHNRVVARLGWPALACGYLLPHLLLLYTDPPAANPAGPAGWFVLTLLLTELNDIAQALVGKAVGGPKITPRLSPKKTWAGLLGGLATTAAVAALIAPMLGPWAWTAEAGLRLGPLMICIFIGLAFGITGFLGDLSMSAVKRDAKVKDSSDVLPGQGGVLDRCDSLLLTAPLFYHALRWGLLGDG